MNTKNLNDAVQLLERTFIALQKNNVDPALTKEAIRLIKEYINAI